MSDTSLTTKALIGVLVKKGIITTDEVRKVKEKLIEHKMRTGGVPAEVINELMEKL